LIALKFYDGTVTGQYVDQFGHGNGGTHGLVDCLAVSDNVAWISGVFTGGLGQGLEFAIFVVDNGTSANDPPDRISFTHFGDFGGLTCEEFILGPNPLTYEYPQGQIKVK